MQICHAADVHGFASDGKSHTAGSHVYHTHAGYEEETRLIVYSLWKDKMKGMGWIGWICMFWQLI